MNSDLDFSSSSLSCERFISIERHAGNIKTNGDKSCIMTRYDADNVICSPYPIPMRQLETLRIVKKML
jgi:hypothetical protein